MKSNHFATATHQPNPVLYKSVAGRQIPALLPADSAEVKEQFYRERIAYLHQELNELNLLEHPVEIAFLCGEIVATKKLLQALAVSTPVRKRK